MGQETLFCDTRVSDKKTKCLVREKARSLGIAVTGHNYQQWMCSELALGKHGRNSSARNKPLLVQLFHSASYFLLVLSYHAYRLNMPCVNLVLSYFVSMSIKFSVIAEVRYNMQLKPGKNYVDIIKSRERIESSLFCYSLGQISNS